MKTLFYPKLALDGIRKNKRMYLPYLLTCVGMVMMAYIVSFIAHTETLLNFPGAAIAQEMIGMGSQIIAVFAGIFLFYTNSFLLRHRKKEFGLYNILGMGKKNISLILFWENLFIFLLSLGAGLTAGVAFSKLAELGLMNLIEGEIVYTFTLSPEAMLQTVSTFSVIFLLLFLNALIQVRFSSAISLLRSENVGEKPPKSNWVFGILGILFLAAAYYIALRIEEPVSAILWFFVAVLLVILGTYLVMIAGSVLFCRLLQKNKKYYYKANHFVSLSSMVYRMKRNGAGLASICILSTMVLVMLSSTAALYFGSEDTLNIRYPRDVNMEFHFADTADLQDSNIESLQKEVLAVTDRHKISPQDLQSYRSGTVAGFLDGTTVETDVTKVNDFHLDTYADVYQFYIVPLADYNAAMGTDETLGEQEALLYTYRCQYGEDSIGFRGGAHFRIKKQVDEFFGSGEAAMNVIPTMAIIVPDFNAAVDGVDSLVDFSGNSMLQLRWTYNFNTGADVPDQVALTRELQTTFFHLPVFTESREVEKADYYSIFGGLFYLGILLSLVFIFAAVLILYYKQVSEGYEDRSRFEIMQKVGMTQKDIRSSINSQLLTVFFLPLLGAGLHLSFAFPIIRKLLLLFNLNNVSLFAVTTLICFLVFALFYTVVYRITSNAYYHIVSGTKDRT